MTAAVGGMPGEVLMPTPALLLSAVVVTWLVEWVVCTASTRRFSRGDGFALLLVNALTNPLANAAFSLGQVPFVLVEFAVVLTEVALLRLLVVRRWTQAAMLSILANGGSALLSGLF
jgi:hypothetical protein